MAFRRVRLIASAGLAAAVLGGARIAAQAQNWTITSGVSGQEQFTDNVLYAPTHRRSDLITNLSPQISISGESSRLQGILNYSPSLSVYAFTPGQNLIGQNLYANGSATIVPDTLFFDARGAMALVPSTPGLAGGGLGAPLSPQGIGVGVVPGLGIPGVSTQGIPRAQLTQTMSFSGSPYLVHRFDGFGTGELRYTLSTTVLSGGTNVLGAALPNTNTTTNEATFSFLTGERFGRLVSRLTLDDARSSGTGVLNNAKQQTGIVDSSYALTRDVALLASIGHEELTFSGVPPTHINDMVWGAGFALTPALGTDIRASYGHRNGVSAPAISVIYSPTASTTLSATYSSGISTTAQELASNLAVSGVNASQQLIDTRTLLPTALVNAALGVQTGLFHVKQFTGTAAFNLERNHVTAAFNETESGLVSQSTTGPASTSQNSIGGTISWAHDISARATGSLGVGYTRNTFPSLGANEEEDLLTIGTSISYTLNASLSAWAGYNRLERSSPNPALRVNADIVFAGLSKTF